MRGSFGGLITAMVTPFDRDGNVDLGAAEKLASWLMDNGSDGLVIAGTTGEGPTLEDAEKRELWHAAVAAVGGRGSVIAGTGTNDTAHSIRLTRDAEKAGCDAALVVTPYYSRPPQAGLLGHFRAVANNTGLPLVLYDVPARTGRRIEHATLLSLAEVDNIVALKDAAGDVQGAARFIAEAPEGFEVYCGNDGDTLPWLAVGAAGVISVAAHVAGVAMAAMMQCFWEGDIQGAQAKNAALISVYDAMAITSNPIPVKAAVGLLGHAVGVPRLPLPEATPDEVGRIRQCLAAAGLL